MREPPRIVDVRASAKTDAMFFGSLRGIGVYKVIAPRESLEQRSSVSEKIGRSL
jgi:hypothetical protein